MPTLTNSFLPMVSILYAVLVRLSVRRSVTAFCGADMEEFTGAKTGADTPAMASPIISKTGSRRPRSQKNTPINDPRTGRAYVASRVISEPPVTAVPSEPISGAFNPARVSHGHRRTSSWDGPLGAGLSPIHAPSPSERRGSPSPVPESPPRLTDQYRKGVSPTGGQSPRLVHYQPNHKPKSPHYQRGTPTNGGGDAERLREAPHKPAAHVISSQEKLLEDCDSMNDELQQILSLLQKVDDTMTDLTTNDGRKPGELNDKSFKRKSTPPHQRFKSPSTITATPPATEVKIFEANRVQQPVRATAALTNKSHIVQYGHHLSASESSAFFPAVPQRL